MESASEGIFAWVGEVYLKSNEWAQRTGEISDTSPTSLKFLVQLVLSIL